MFGIDVSSNNGFINWNKVKAQGVEFAILRCGIGSNFASLLMSQISENQNIIPLIEDLLDEDGSELYMKSVADLYAEMSKRLG